MLSTRELMERMGHASPAVAIRYEHVMADRDAEIARRLDQLGRARAGTRRARPKKSEGGEEAG